MASRAFIQRQMVKLENNYGRERFKITQSMFEIWADVFKDFDEDGFEASIDEYIRTNEFPPTVASIAKIYKSKLEYRKDLMSYLKSKYVWITKWFGEEPSQEVFSQFCKYILKFPKDDRKLKADELTRKAVVFYNDKRNTKTFKEYLEGL